MPQNDCFKAGFFSKLLGSLELEEEEEELLLFFESTTPRLTPTAMSTASVNTEPMT